MMTPCVTIQQGVIFKQKWRKHMVIVKTWCENTKEGMDYLKFNGYQPICRLTKKLWMVGRIGNPMTDIKVKCR